jgi:hypothetical protein
MVWAELCCVGTILVIAALVGFCHVRDERAGKMNWAAMDWKKVSCDRSGRSVVLALIRLSMSIYAWVTIFIMVTSPVRKLKGGSPSLGGPYVLCTFTVWSWTLIAVYLGAAGLSSTLDALGFKPTGGGARLFLCIMWVGFEAMFSCAILVFLIVWLVLLPFIYLQTGTDGGMLRWVVLSAHNLNLVFMCVECALNSLVFNPSHFVFVLYYGLAYVVFSWIWFCVSGKFYYFFIDWRMPFTPIAYVLLIGIIFGAFVFGRRLSDCMKRRHEAVPLDNSLSILGDAS